MLDSIYYSYILPIKESKTLANCIYLGSMLQGFISPYRVAQDGSRTAFESKYEKLY